MNLHRPSVVPWCLALLALCQLSTAPVLAQGDAATTKVEVFPLKNARAGDTAEVLMQVFRDRKELSIAVDDKANSVIVRAAPGLVGEVGKLIVLLDQKAIDAEPKHDVFVFSLERIDADQKLVEAMKLLVPNAKAGQFVVDPGRKVLIVHGPPRLRETIEAVLTRLEQNAALQTSASKGLQVRIVWLVGGKLAKGEQGVPAGTFPELSDELAKLGLNPFRFAAQELVHVTPGSPFSISGGATADGLQTLRVSGKVAHVQAGVAKLDLTLTVSQPAQGTPKLCDLQTELRVPLGKMVVIGSTPLRGEPTAFLVQVEETGAAKPAAKKATQ